MLHAHKLGPSHNNPTMAPPSIRICFLPPLPSPPSPCLMSEFSLDPGPGFSMETLHLGKQENSPVKQTLKQWWDNYFLGSNFPMAAYTAIQFSSSFPKPLLPTVGSFQVLPADFKALYTPLPPPHSTPANTHTHSPSLLLLAIFAGLSHWPVRLCRVHPQFSRPIWAKPWPVQSDPRAGPA